jgi:hypothetical protein
MNEPERNVLLLIGSAKPVGSVSEILGGYLVKQMESRGYRGDTMRIVPRIEDEKRMQRLLEAAVEAETVVLSFGLYMDAPPAPVIRLLELWYRHRVARSIHTGRLVTVVNCGMPEADAARKALPFVQRFAQKASLHWAGGLFLGMSEMIDGRELQELGTMARHCRAGLDRSAEALAAGRDIPKQARDLVARPFVPRWLFLWFGMRRWQNHAQ